MPGAWSEDRAFPSMSMFTGMGVFGIAAGGSQPSGSFANEMALRAIKASLKIRLSPLQ